MKDIYQLEINSSGCNYEIWLNEIRIDIQLWNRPIVYDLPINQWIKTGVNKLEIKILPLSKKAELESKAYFKITICQGTLVGKIFSKLKELKKIETPSFQELKQNSENIDISSYLLKENFEIDFLFSNSIFIGLNSISVKKEELILLYKSITSYFQNQDAVSLMSLMEYKMKGFSKSYQDSYSDERERQMIFLKNLFNKKIELVNYDDYSIQYFLKDKIVCLEDKVGDQPLFFSDSSGESYFFYPFYFGIEKNNSKLIVVL